MSTIFKKLYLSIPFTILVSLILCFAIPLFYTGKLSPFLLQTFSMNLSLLISAILLFLFYYLRYKRRNTKPLLTNIILSLLSLSLGLIFLNITQISFINRMLLWIFPLMIFAYYFKSFIVNLLLTIVFIFTLSSYVFYVSPILTFQSIPFVKLMTIVTAIILLFISNIPIIIRKYSSFSSTYKVFALFMILQNIVAIFITTAFSLNGDYIQNSLISNNNTSLLLLLSIIPTALALLSFSSYFLNRTQISSYLKIETCLSILVSIVMIFILNFPSTILSLIISGLCFILISMILYYIAYSSKNPFLLTLMNIIILVCVLQLIIIFKISALPISIPIISYLILSIVLNIPLKRLSN